MAIGDLQKKNNYKRNVGHLLGFNKLTETLEWCMALGVTEVTLYAFSIENFKRSKDEIDSLMELARQKFSSLLAEKELIDRHGLCLRIIGNMDYLPEDLQKLFAEGILATKHNNKAFLNICCPYTSREEMTQAMKQLARGVKLGYINESDIDEELFDKCLYTRKSPEPDIIIRTSGEVRLSDFLLWQSSYSVLSFSRVLWPEFTHWHFYQGILFYQQNFKAVQKAKMERDERRRATRLEMDVEEARKRLRPLATQTDGQKPSSSSLDGLTTELSTLVSQVTSERLKRVLEFLDFFRNRLRQAHHIPSLEGCTQSTSKRRS